MVISSTGGAGQHQGAVLGQYEYHEDKGYYVQTSTEQSNEKFVARYLYRDQDDKWWVGPTPGAKSGRWLRNTSPSQTPLSSGWLYADKTTKSWQDDQTLTVTPGPLPPLPKQFTVTVTEPATRKLSSYQGVFTKTQRWWHGRPVYVNTEGQLLHHSTADLGWSIGDKLGKYTLRGSQARHSPVDEDNWRYWDGSEDKPASVTVTGSD